MEHPIVDVFAFQEALLLEAVFAIAILTMIWIGFRRWLQYRERMGQLIAKQTAEYAAHYGSHIDQVEARLKAIEQMLTDGGAPTPEKIDALRSKPIPDGSTP